MIPLSITLKGYGSFVEEETFTFPTGPGLYFMTGRNLAEPRLGRNGAGKSTLWAALTWVLFGKNPFGLKAGDVANWDNPKGAKVSMEFLYQDRVWCVKRTHSPNSWKLRLPDDELGTEGLGCWEDLTDDSTNVLYNFLRLEFGAWLQSVLMMAQGDRMFMDLGATEKSALFSQVMNLDRWLVFSKTATNKASSEALVIDGLGYSLSKVQGRIEQLSDTRVIDEEAGRWEDKRLRDIEDLMNRHEATLALSDSTKVDEEKALEDLKWAEHRLREARELEQSTRVEADTLQAQDREHGIAHANAVYEVGLIRKQRDEANRNDKCPTCGAPADHHRLHRQLEAAETEVSRLEPKARDAESRYVRAREDLLKRSETARQRDEERRAMDRHARELRIAWDSCNKELDRIEEEADRLGHAPNPFITALEDQRHDLEKARNESAEIQERIDECADRLTRLDFWVRGFKDIRLELIGEALNQLEIETNSEVVQLGLTKWEIGFSIDRETQAGTVSRGFAVNVRSPKNSKSVPWFSWSGGETQRLRIAGQMGMSNLVRSSTGATIPLEVWDEPTDGMSDEGITDLLNALKARAEREKRQIWMVDHRALGYGQFDGQVTVVKGADWCSRFEWSTQ